MQLFSKLTKASALLIYIRPRRILEVRVIPSQGTGVSPHPQGRGRLVLILLFYVFLYDLLALAGSAQPEVNLRVLTADVSSRRLWDSGPLFVLNVPEPPPLIIVVEGASLLSWSGE